MRDKISVLDAKCSVEMVKRFGENVTMGDIESFAVNRTLEEMKEIARRKEQSLYKTIQTGQDKSKKEKSKLCEKIKVNTTLMDKKTQLLDENASLEGRRKKDKVALDKLEERKLRRPEEQQELRELWELFRSQERELHEMRLRLSRFMTKGAPVFLNPSKIERKSSISKPKFHPHVHFSRSLTNGSSGENNAIEHIPEAVDDVHSKIHKGRPVLQGPSTSSLKAETDQGYHGKIFEESTGHGLGQDITKGDGVSRKRSGKKAAMRPKSSRHPRAGKRATKENVPETDDLEMDKEGDENEEEKVKRKASKDSEIGDNNDDTSKDFTSLSLATASASGAVEKQSHPKISVTNEPQ